MSVELEAKNQPLPSQNKTQSQGKVESDRTQSDSDKRGELEERIRKRVACEERAFRIVQKLVENTVSPDYIKSAVAYINPAHYDDIVEERFISKMCGYPVCQNVLKKILKQKYKICTKTNQVFDISDSKRFCSTQCYKASRYLQGQVPTSPVWARHDEPPPQVQLLLSKTSSGEIGESILPNPRQQVRREVEQLDDANGVNQHGEDRTDDDKQQRCDVELPEAICTEELDADMSRAYGLHFKKPPEGDNNKRKQPPTDITTATHDEQNSKAGVDFLYQPYCHRNPSHQSKGYVNRATYYGYDEKQQELKAVVCEEILHGDFTTRSHKSEKYVSSQKGKTRLSQSSKEKIQTKMVVSRRSNSSSCGNGSKTTPLFVDIPDESAFQQEKSLTNNNHSNIVGHGDCVSMTTSSTESETQNKIDNLMRLLDKRDALNQRLAEASEDSAAVTKRGDKVRVNAQIGESADKLNTVKCNGNHSKESVKTTKGEGQPRSSTHVFESIERASHQGFTGHFPGGALDSDDDTEDVTDPAELTSRIQMLSIDGQNSRENGHRAVLPTARDVLSVICDTLWSWRTKASVAYLRGTHGGDLSSDRRSLSMKIHSQIKQYSHLLDDDEDPSTCQSKPVPAYSQLQTDPYTLKVKEFYSGGGAKAKSKAESDRQVIDSRMMEKSVAFEGKKKKKLFDFEPEVSTYDRTELVTEKDVCLPYIDSQSQNGLRRKIVLDKLTKVFEDILGPLQLSVRDISGELRAIVHTFNFTSQNIVLKPTEWTLVAYCVLQMLSSKVKVVQAALRRDEVTRFFDSLLGGAGVDSTRLRGAIDAFIYSDPEEGK